MILCIHRPRPPLDRFVESIVFHEGYTTAHTLERVLPDTSVNLIFDLTEVPKRIFDNQSHEAIQHCRRAWISGIHRNFLTIDSARESSMFVIRFHPGGAHALLGLPIGEIREQVVEIEQVLDRSFLQMRDELQEAPTPEQKFEIAERRLLERLEPHRIPGRVLEYAVGMLGSGRDGITVNRVHLDLGVSRRHLGRLFERWVGVSPKRFHRLARFRRVLEEIQREGQVDWTGLALDCGYYDQAHFANEFKAFSGLNPSRFLVEKGEHLGFVPVR